MSFGFKLPDNGTLPSGDYYTISQAFGKDKLGNEVISNETRTDFAIKWKEIAALFEARANEEEEEDIVLAATEDRKSNCESEEDFLPYLLLFLLSSFWLIEKSRNLPVRRADETGQ